MIRKDKQKKVKVGLDGQLLEQLQVQLAAAREGQATAEASQAEAEEKSRRALADYQNLVRRNQEERLKLLSMANQDLIENLLQPLEHLNIAAQQLNDPGLNMVVEQIWQVLEEQGLEAIDPQGQKFNVETMEVVEKEGSGDKVIKVIRKGYRLNGQVIQYAKVVVG